MRCVQGIKQFFTQYWILLERNVSVISLIPKMLGVDDMKDFRSISGQF